MGQVLYRKYRSKTLDDVVGQEHITTTLKNSLESGKISHAFLFTGPRGVGKTSVARILAHQVNGLDYNEKENYLDIIEIDAASNRRIDEIRELRERVFTAPANAKYKVYIIDEVHMLTKEAFNALLKTLEEPPDHAIFILATTEISKVPDTIVSRTQRFSFKPISKIDATKHLKFIAKKEHIKVADEAIELIVEHADGSFRDSISLLDQCSDSHSAITLSKVEDMIGLAPRQTINLFLNLTFAGLGRELLEKLSNSYSAGSTAAQITKQLVKELRVMVTQSDKPVNGAEITKLMRTLIEVPTSHDPETALELALLDVCLKVPATVKVPFASKDAPSAPKNVKKQQSNNAPLEILPATLPKSHINSTVPKYWSELINSLKKDHNTLYSLAKTAKVSTDKSGKGIILSAPYAFHAKRLNDSKNKEIITDKIFQLTNQKIAIKCIVGTSSLPEENISGTSSVDDLETISNIFEGAEVLKL